jgi:hypothetical protein
MKRSQLSAGPHSPAGEAPAEAWEAVGGELTRPRDIWIAGPTGGLLTNPVEWKSKLRDRWQPPQGPLGLRLRFVVSHLRQMGRELLDLVGVVLDALPDAGEELFLHCEVMTGPEQGLYLAYDNRPPALLTQIWLANRESESLGRLPATEGPVHLSLVLHDPDVGFREIWNDGTLSYALNRLAAMFPDPDIHQLSVARSSAHPHGISIGIERPLREEGAEGGASAAEPASRLRSHPEELATPTTRPGLSLPLTTGESSSSSE